MTQVTGMAPQIRSAQIREGRDCQLARLVPPDVICVEAIGEGDDAGLGPAEVLTGATPRRRREFALGRRCAHLAMMRLGRIDMPIPMGTSREPIWPAGLVGSITHCEGYCAAAIGMRDRLVAIGIDAEPNDALPSGLLDLIARDEEQSWLREQRHAGIRWDRLLFSAKESIYKAWFPVARR